jgi:hypothetical protein
MANLRLLPKPDVERYLPLGRWCIGANRMSTGGEVWEDHTCPLHPGFGHNLAASDPEIRPGIGERFLDRLGMTNVSTLRCHDHR